MLEFSSAVLPAPSPYLVCQPLKRRKSVTSLKFDAIYCIFISGCEWHIVRAKVGKMSFRVRVSHQ